MESRCSRIACSLLCALLALVAIDASAGLESFGYQVPMGPAPPAVAHAIATVPERSATVIGAMACGHEFDFINHFSKKDNGEGITAEVLAKLARIQATVQYTTGTTIIRPPCEFKIAVAHWDVCKLYVADCSSEDQAKKDA